MKQFRNEKDSLGIINIPQNAYWGVHAQRALNNFPISGLKPDTTYIYSTVIIKKAAAKVNRSLSSLEDNKFQAILKACDEILAGKFIDQFVVDPYQAGTGTSHNMNANEVIANRANEILGAPLGSYKYIHPNDHVNMSQSTNDVIPSSIRLSCLMLLPNLLKELKSLIVSFNEKVLEFKKIKKPGRTHLQDALPVTLGNEFSAYSQALNNDLKRIQRSADNLKVLGIGGTAVGTGTNSLPKYRKLMIEELSRLTKLKFKSSENLFESMQNTSDFLDFSSSLRTLSQNLIRICNDLRLLSSGPKTGFSEIILPEVQAGSSIMPGKVNPSIPEMATMVCFQVIGFDQAILLSAQAGQLELNIMLPLIAFNLMNQVKLLTNSIAVLRDKCIDRIVADEKMCEFWLVRSLGSAALLNQSIGYEKAAAVMKFALKNNISLKHSVLKLKYLPETKVNQIYI